MSAQHTPGPWVVSKGFRAPVVGYAIPDGGEPLPIVDVVHGYDQRQARANAVLIAASTDLLEAAKLALVTLSDLEPGSAEVIALRKAIAKATGRAA
jgi:hypothetical protein